VTYDDPRTGERVRERKIQEIPYEDLKDVRNRELAVVRAPRSGGQDAVTKYHGADNDDDQYHYTVRRRRTQEYARDRASYAPRGDDVYDRRPARRRSYDDYSDSDSSRESRRRRRHRPRDGDSSSKNSVRNNPARIQNEEDEGRCWYSEKARSDANFLEKNFDSSYDGIIAAAAGAAIGVVTARHYGGEKNKAARTLGAAAAGAAVFNAGENWFRVFTEERQEKKEAKQKEKRSY